MHVDIIQTIQCKMLKWHGCVQKMEEQRQPKKILEWIPHNHSRQGMPRKW